MIDDKNAARLFRLADRMEAMAGWIAGLKLWVVVAVGAGWIALQLVDTPTTQVVSLPLLLAGVMWLGGRMRLLLPYLERQDRLVGRRTWLRIGLAGVVVASGFGLVTVLLQLDQTKRAHEISEPAQPSLPPVMEK